MTILSLVAPLPRFPSRQRGTCVVGAWRQAPVL